MGLPSQGSDSNIMFDAFMAFRQMMNYLDNIAITINKSNATLRVSIEGSPATVPVSLSTVTTVTSVTNIVNFGGRDATIFQNDIMYKVWLEAIRNQIT